MMMMMMMTRKKNTKRLVSLSLYKNILVHFCNIVLVKERPNFVRHCFTVLILCC